MPWMMRAPGKALLLCLCAGLAACSSSPGEPGCRVDGDCPSGRYCLIVSHTCVYDCTFDNECGAGYECSVRGRCQPEQCQPSNGGVEDCNRVDDDCDGATDEDLAERACQRQNQFGTCPGLERCSAGAWACDAREPAAESCGGQDEDCDGQLDEGFFLGEACDGVGECGAGVLECAGPGGTHCSTDPGGSASQATPESCDGLDDDCDGATDEDAPAVPTCETGALAGDGLDNNCNGLVDEPGGCVVHQPFLGSYIDAYETVLFANPDCTGTRYGEDWDDYPADWPDGDVATERRLYACSLPGLRPSRALTWHQAKRACEDTGKRLCTKTEWSQACGGSLYWNFPYGQAYSPGACNTFSAGFGETRPGGSLPECVTEQGAYDMSGSLWEWIGDECDTGDGRRSIQGGSYWCELVDPDSGQWVLCDQDNPAHADEIAERHGCQYPMDRGFCDWPTTVSWGTGVRCCLDGR